MGGKAEESGFGEGGTRAGSGIRGAGTNGEPALADSVSLPAGCRFWGEDGCGLSSPSGGGEVRMSAHRRAGWMPPATVIQGRRAPALHWAPVCIVSCGDHGHSLTRSKHAPALV